MLTRRSLLAGVSAAALVGSKAAAAADDGLPLFSTPHPGSFASFSNRLADAEPLTLRSFDNFRRQISEPESFLVRQHLTIESAWFYSDATGLVEGADIPAAMRRRWDKQLAASFAVTAV